MNIKEKFCVIKTKAGNLYISAEQEGITAINWTERECSSPATALLKQTAQELTEYFAGVRTEFTFRIMFEASAFRKNVWEELIRVPYGETRSYREIAAAVGRPKAVRAAGTAIGKNPLMIVIPCHRIICTDGSIGGYAGGPEKKRFLLELEKKR